MKHVNIEQDYIDHQQENENLRAEILQLRRELEREQILHKTLYNQWSELNARMLEKEREFVPSTSQPAFYKYAFYVLLVTVIPVIFFLNRSNGDESIVTPATIVSSADRPIDTLKTSVILNTEPTPSPVQTVTHERDSLQRPRNFVEESKVIRSEIQKPQPPVANQPAPEVPFTEAARNAVYWEGWNAYYDNSQNPYKREPLKNAAWLAGWKDGENDSKKQPAKDSSSN